MVNAEDAAACGAGTGWFPEHADRGRALWAPVKQQGGEGAKEEGSL